MFYIESTNPRCHVRKVVRISNGPNYKFSVSGNAKKISDRIFVKFFQNETIILEVDKYFFKGFCGLIDLTKIASEIKFSLNKFVEVIFIGSKYLKNFLTKKSFEFKEFKNYFHLSKKQCSSISISSGPLGKYFCDYNMVKLFYYLFNLSSPVNNLRISLTQSNIEVIELKEEVKTLKKT